MIAKADLLAAFPSFANSSIYPDASIAFWIAQAYASLPLARLRTRQDFAAMLFVAHYLTLAARDAVVVANGGVPGAASGVLASASVGPVSKSYDTKLTTTEGAGFWNATSYGQQLWQILRFFGTGPMYVASRPAGIGYVPGDVGYAYLNRNDGF